MLSTTLAAYARSHRNALLLSFSQFRQSMLSSSLLILVISIAFSLPIALWVLSINAKAITNTWPHSTQLSMFIDKTLVAEETTRLLTAVRQQPLVAFANYISPEQGLQTLEEETGMDNVASLLSNNPLPAIIEVHPTTLNQTSVEPLLTVLSQMKGVSQVQMDLQWLLRLDSILTLAQKGVMGLMGLLCAAVILVVGNTIRLAVINREKEIEVLTLIGATNAYIRRPFLYFGGLYGLLGALFAWLGLSVLMLWLQQSVSNIARLYYTHFHLIGMSLSQGLILLLLGGGLGYLAAFFSVSQQLLKKSSDYGF